MNGNQLPQKLKIKVFKNGIKKIQTNNSRNQVENW